jgi:hypothetical protein
MFCATNGRNVQDCGHRESISLKIRNSFFWSNHFSGNQREIPTRKRLW